MGFSSNEELLIAARDLISGLKARGADDSAKILHDLEPYKCPQKLTFS